MPSFNNYYPKNYGASGLGLVNLAALGYSDGEREKKPVGLYPSLPYPAAANLSYPSVPPASGTSPYPTSSYPASAPYPSSTPYPNTTPYPTSMGGMPTPYGNSPYPSAPAVPSLPYPGGAGFPGMPMPYDNVSQNSQSSGYSSLYPSIPSLPDGPGSFSGLDRRDPPSNLYPTLKGEEDSDITLPTQEEEPSVGVPEIPFHNIKVPENENMFWQVHGQEDPKRVSRRSARSSRTSNGSRSD